MAFCRKKDKKQKKQKRQKLSEEDQKIKEDFEKDLASHGGWWSITKVEEAKGPIVIEMGKRVYVSCMDNGKFTLGVKHDSGAEPDITEQFTGVVLSNNKIALKTGFGKYLSVDHNSTVVGRSDAIASMEMWEPVFEQGKLALLAPNNRFMSWGEDGDMIATSESASKENFVKIRSNGERNKIDEKDLPPVEERNVDNMRECEVNYVKKFQSWKDGKLRLSAKDVEELDKAKDEGKLHNALLDRRAKMKSDRYCM